MFMNVREHGAFAAPEGCQAAVIATNITDCFGPNDPPTEYFHNDVTIACGERSVRFAAERDNLALSVAASTVLKAVCINCPNNTVTKGKADPVFGHSFGTGSHA